MTIGLTTLPAGRCPERLHSGGRHIPAPTGSAGSFQEIDYD